MIGEWFRKKMTIVKRARVQEEGNSQEIRKSGNNKDHGPNACTFWL